MKKYGTLIGLVALLVVAVVINVRTNKISAQKLAPQMEIGVNNANVEQEETFARTEEYFETFRENRENTREKELSYLETILTQKEVDAETLVDAQQQKLAIVESMEKEFTVESVLKAKGFADAAVTFHKGAVNVIIKAETLTNQQVAQILDIVCRETGEKADNIKISVAQN